MPGDTLILGGFDSLNIHNKNQNIFIIVPSKKETNEFLGINKEYATLILIPILSFLLALLFNWIRGKLKIKSQLLLSQKFLFTLADLIQSQILKQKKSIEDFSQGINLSGNTRSPFTRVDLHIDKLRIIKSPELVQLFVTNRRETEEKKNELLFNWENNVSLLERKVRNIQNLFDRYKEFYEKNISEWNKNIDFFHDAYVTFMQSQISDTATTIDINVAKINSIHSDWSKTKKHSQKNTKEMLLDPMEEVCKEFISRYPKNDKIVSLRKSISILNRTYTDLEFNNNFYFETFPSYSNDLDKAYERLIETKTKIQKIKFKSLIYLK